MKETSEKTQKTSSEKKKRNNKPRKIRKPSAVLIWILIEAVLVLGVIIAAVIKNVYGKTADTGKEYTIPTEEAADVDISQIELPTDLTADSEVEDVAVGDIYDMNYSESVLTMLSGMDTKSKVCALLVTTPEALCNKSNVTVAGDVFRGAYEEDPVSGLFFTDSNFTSEADGMNMLATIRGWSRDRSGMNVLLAYSGEMNDPLAQSERGINTYMIMPGTENAGELSESASDNNMLPAHFVSLDEVPDGEDKNGLYIVATDDINSIIGAINEGRSFLYMTGDYRNICDGLVQAAAEGALIAEALDSAAGHALTAREMLTQLRPEDSERIPPEEEEPKPEAKKAETKAKAEPKKMTPEEEAAAALAALQKQAEDAMRAAVKQAEDAAKAAAEQE
ncbi:MAG: hypothetical protein J5574_01785 [Lachnospiraceae bacterium]|nr:hypothetical protein [Lachnospiraceae bacterium]